MNLVLDNQEMSTPRLILLACGSFSPPTPMHMRMFEIARDYFEMMGSYKVVGGIMSPVHDSYGKKDLAPAKHRCAMVKLSLHSSNWIRLSDWEVNQSQWSRTRNVLQYHQNYINNYINANEDEINELLPMWLPEGLRRRKDKIHLKLLCGADLLESFSVPGLWLDEDIEEIVGNHGIIVISRRGSNPEQFIFDSDILTKYQKNITIVTNWVPNEVSSTMIRRLLGRGQSVKYLIDDNVIEYIKLQGLFNVKSPKYATTANNLIENQNLFNDNYINDTTSPNSSKEMEEMDETDTVRGNSMFLEIHRPKVFCCRGAETTRSVISRPGQAVQVITNCLDVQQAAERNSEIKIKKIRRDDYSCD